MFEGLRRGCAWRKFLEVGADDRVAAYGIKSLLGIMACLQTVEVVKDDIDNESGTLGPSADHAAS